MAFQHCEEDIRGRGREQLAGQNDCVPPPGQRRDFVAAQVEAQVLGHHTAEACHSALVAGHFEWTAQRWCQLVHVRQAGHVVGMWRAAAEAEVRGHVY